MSTFYLDIYHFAVDLAASCKVFTLAQVARHPKLADRSQPVKRASEILAKHKESFEKFPAPIGQPFRFRLSKKERKRLGIKYPSIDPNTQRIKHWLMLGDLWVALSLYVPFGDTSEQPTIWIPEPRDSAMFDLYCVWKGKEYLFELQNYKLNGRGWEKKWQLRKRWIDTGRWKKAPWQHSKPSTLPDIILVAKPQTDEVMQIPGWVTWIKDIEDVPRRLVLRQDRARQNKAT